MLYLGDFELAQPIGKGGMAQVWRGRHRDADVGVAVKIVAPSRGRNLARHLANEARTMAQLDHPGIVMVFDQGTVSPAEAAASDGLLSEGSPYIVMELAERGTALERCGKLRWPQIRNMLLRLLDALAHAHARGVLHRDVKPSNVLVFDDDDVKLSDFGLARALHPDDDSNDGLKAGGTPAYMAPEQFSGAWREYDCATDLYALGCVAHALVAGKPPYGSWRDLKLMLRLHNRGVLPAIEALMPVPLGFEDWVRRLLEKNPRRRFQRAADAAAALMKLGPARNIHKRHEGERVTGQPPPTLSDDATVPTTVEDDDTITDEPTFDGVISVHPEPLLPDSWERRDGDRPSMQRLRAGLGLYSLRAVPFVGRRAERSAMWRALGQVAFEMTQRVLVLEGPAGCGKSRLAEWLTERAHETGAANVLKAVHGPRSGPGNGLAAMLRRHLRLSGLDRETLRAHLISALTRWGVDDEHEVDALTDLLAPERRLVPAKERYALLTRFTARLAARRLLILWLDDVQWGLDALAFAEHLVAASPQRVLIMLTARSEALADRPAEQAALARLSQQSRSERLEVGPLAPEEQPALVDRLLHLDPELAREVAARTRGNPLFAVQLVGDWVERGLLEPSREGFRLSADAEVTLPDELHAMCVDRVERFLADRSVHDALGLELAAVLGQHIDADEWQRLCEIAETSPTASLVPDLARRRLADAGDDGWSFVHEMLRESVERRAHDAGRLVAHHRACAQMLGERVGRGLSARLAHHLLAAGDRDAALAPLLAAAREHTLTADYVTARQLLDERERALRALGVAEQDGRWAEGWLARARVSIKLAELAAARALVDRTEACAELAISVERGLLRGELARLRGAVGEARDRLVAAVERAKSLPALHAEGLELLGRVRMHLGEAGASEAAFRQARAIFLALGDEVGAADAEWQLAHAATYRGDYIAAHDHNERAMRDLNRLGDRWSVARCLNSRGEIARLRGDLRAAEAAYREARGLLDSLGAVDSAAICDANVARVQVERGEYRMAQRTLEESAAKFSELGRLDPLAWVKTVLLCCLAADQAWHAWDAGIGEVERLLDDSGYLDLDIGRSAQMAGDLALAAGHSRRAKRAYTIAQAQWQGLGREVECSEVTAALARCS